MLQCSQLLWFCFQELLIMLHITSLCSLIILFMITWPSTWWLCLARPATYRWVNNWGGVRVRVGTATGWSTCCCSPTCGCCMLLRGAHKLLVQLCSQLLCIMPAYATMLLHYCYAQNYAGIILQGLIVGTTANPCWYIKKLFHFHQHQVVPRLPNFFSING